MMSPQQVLAQRVYEAIVASYGQEIADEVCRKKKRAAPEACA